MKKLVFVFALMAFVSFSFVNYAASAREVQETETTTATDDKKKDECAKKCEKSCDKSCEKECCKKSSECTKGKETEAKKD